MKTVMSVQRSENDIRKMGVNGYSVQFVKNGFTKHVFTFKSNFYFGARRKQRILYFTNLTVLHL